MFRGNGYLSRISIIKISTFVTIPLTFLSASLVTKTPVAYFGCFFGIQHSIVALITIRELFQFKRRFFILYGPTILMGGVWNVLLLCYLLGQRTKLFQTQFDKLFYLIFYPCFEGLGALIGWNSWKCLCVEELKILEVLLETDSLSY